MKYFSIFLVLVSMIGCSKIGQHTNGVLHDAVKANNEPDNFILVKNMQGIAEVSGVSSGLTAGTISAGSAVLTATTATLSSDATAYSE